MITEKELSDKVFDVIMKNALHFHHLTRRFDSRGNEEVYGALFPDGYLNWILISFSLKQDGFYFSIKLTPTECEPQFINLEGDQHQLLLRRLIAKIEQKQQQEKEEKLEKNQYAYNLFFDYVNRVEQNAGHNN